MLSARARAISLRSYQRPVDADGKIFETWEQTIQRAQYDHHLRLWEEAGGSPNIGELEELRQLGLDRKSLVSGRTLWLGGTEYAYNRSACQFNCAIARVQTVFDLVNAAWLLLNGSVKGSKPIPGTLHGYVQRIQSFSIIPSMRTSTDKGRESNTEQKPNSSNGYHWIITIGDSAEAWAKAIGKMFSLSVGRAKKLTLDFSQVRGPGGRLRGYGWICNGSEPLQRAMARIHEMLNAKAGEILDEIDIMDVLNHIGTVLSSRRSAESTLMDSTNPRMYDFATAKRNFWEPDMRGNTRHHRQQSNNSLLFWEKPSRRVIEDMMRLIWDNGGSEPGLVNADNARRRAPWFDGFNPCFEILLPSRGFCNLVTNIVPRFDRDFNALERAVYIISRANYRQTCVNLQDGMLSVEWHQNNESLRLCGVSLCGVVQAEWLTDYQIRRLRNAAVAGTYSMADELGMPRPKLVTTIKPEGTAAKISGHHGMEIMEGVHKSMGRHIFNWVNFSIHDPLVERLKLAGYKTIANPGDSNNVLVCFPVKYNNATFDVVNGKEVNLESAVKQLERYRRWNTLWADHNCSITVSYSEDEIPSIVDWFDNHWNDYVAVSFLKRNDPTKTAKDLGYEYLPQEVVSGSKYNEYADSLREPDFSNLHGIYDLPEEAGCQSGVCPIR